MAGLVPAIHVFMLKGSQDVDTRHKAGHDEIHCRTIKRLRGSPQSYTNAASSRSIAGISSFSAQ